MLDTIDGFYSAYISGLGGNGFAIVVIKDRKLFGVDPLGVKFDGSFAETNDGQELFGKIKVTAPPNGTLVQGVSTGPAGLNYEIEARMPVKFTSEPFIELKTPFGPLNIRLEKVREIF